MNMQALHADNRRVAAGRRMDYKYPRNRKPPFSMPLPLLPLPPLPLPPLPPLPSAAVVFYYQTTTDVGTLLESGVPMSSVVVYVSSLHFCGRTLLLNNAPPDAQPADLWANVDRLRAAGATIMVMLGGAGGAYEALFADFEPCYGALLSFLRARPFIAGIDLDVEEGVGLDPVCGLLRRLAADRAPGFAITMAPIASAMLSDAPGLGGFSYADLCARPEGRLIEWFNVQCYGCYDATTFASVLENGHEPSRVVLGMLGDEVEPGQLGEAVAALRTTLRTYPTLRGAALWEYGDTNVDPVAFAQGVYGVLHAWETRLWDAWATLKQFVLAAAAADGFGPASSFL